MTIFPVSDEDGSWAAFKAQWQEQCEHLGENFAEYATVAFSALDPLAAQEHPRAAIYAVELSTGQTPVALCQLNCTMLPGYDSEVLRVRFITLSPDYDFGDKGVEDYAAVLATLFADVLVLSRLPGKMAARHLKFHLRSPADRQFFGALRTGLAGVRFFETVGLHGSWLHVSMPK